MPRRAASKTIQPRRSFGRASIAPAGNRRYRIQGSPTLDLSAVQGRPPSLLWQLPPMNKAFVREPDDTGQLNCPACGSLGIPVARETWSAHVQPSAGAQLAESAFF